MIRATPPEGRSQFAQEIWGKRKAHYGETGRSDSRRTMTQRNRADQGVGAGEVFLQDIEKNGLPGLSDHRRQSTAP
jgi:hypothetical protein